MGTPIKRFGVRVGRMLALRRLLKARIWCRLTTKRSREWLVETFGEEPFLIGLTRLANQTEWQWTSGEPVAYTNWALPKLTTDRDALVFVNMRDGKWHIRDLKHLPRTGIALLEKEDGNTDKP